MTWFGITMVAVLVFTSFFNIVTMVNPKRSKEQVAASGLALMIHTLLLWGIFAVGTHYH